MNKKIDETQKNPVSDIQNGKVDPGSYSDDFGDTYDLNFPGDPDCPLCGGLGYLRADYPVGHPEFGNVEICSCRDKEITKIRFDKLYQLSNLKSLRNMTFDNFEKKGRFGLSPEESNSLELAFNQATLFSTNLKGWLLIHGGYGCGKTHLAAAIANFAVNLGVPTLFITVPDLLDSLRISFGSENTNYEERFDQIRQAGLLVLDDFGTQNATQWAQEKLFQIANFRYTNKLPTVFTTNVPLDEIEERIQSRLMDPELVTTVKIIAPDFRNPKSDIGHHRISILTHSTDWTFEKFDLRENAGLTGEEQNSLERAFQSSLDFAKKPNGWLILNGTYGCGKTHLAGAIANYIAKTNYPPPMVSVPRMLKYLRGAFKSTANDSIDRRLDEIISAQVLILDDLGAEYPTAWVREQLFMLFDERYIMKLPTVITTPIYYDEMDPRIVSRLKDTRLCKICSITAPSYFSTPGRTKKSSRR